MPEYAVPRTAAENIDTVARLQAEYEHERSFSDRIADSIGTFAGKVSFVLLHLFAFGFWVVINSELISFLPAFDPYPFSFLTMFVSLEGVLLSTFVLIKQNRMSKRADRREELNLQISLLAEKEVTKIIQMLEHISEHLGIEREVIDDEVRELGQVTAVDRLAHELKIKMKDEE